MILSLIAAIGKNNEIGKKNMLLWHLPADMKFFRATTKGHGIIMGRKTFESLPGLLPNRRNVIITRDKKYKVEGGDVVHSLEEALEIFGKTDEEVFVIGGAEIYKQAIDVADKLYITHIDGEVKGADAFFPEIVPIVWNEVSHKENKPDDKNPIPYTFSVYEKFF